MKRKAESEDFVPIKQMMDSWNGNQDEYESSSKNLQYKRITPDESRLSKIVDLTIEEVQHYVCQLDHFKKCYKLAEQKGDIISF